MLQSFKRALPKVNTLIRAFAGVSSNLSDYEMLDKLEGSNFDAYDEEGFSINNVYHKGSVMAFNNNAFFWNAKSFQDITPESLSLITFYNPSIDILLIGTGKSFERVPKNVEKFLDDNHIAYESMNSASACATFNFLHNENRQVAAAILAIESKPYVYDDVIKKNMNEFGHSHEIQQ
ncbi:hypothetical protein WA158_001791 [Blastocystis sp. Blastoise]